VSRFASTRSAILGPDARPVSIPEDVGDCPGPKAAGVVVLPERIRWSGLRRRYNLDDRRDRALVYEQVLTEGTDEDVRFFVDLDELVALWDDLVLSQYVREAWSRWLHERGIV
jgi:hypothetical protein